MGDGYCDNCGTQLIPARYCDTCGALAAHAGEFCRECGAKLPTTDDRQRQVPSGQSNPKQDVPDWLKEPEPPQQQVPDWLKEPEPKPKPEPPRRKPRASKPAAPPDKAQDNKPVMPAAPATPAPAQRASLARRWAAAPVPMRLAPPVPPATAADNALMLTAGISGLLGIVAVASSPVLGMILFLVMLAAGGRRLRYGTGQAIGAVIDWLWEDPVLRRRLLGE
jgi:hypothetical protein